MLQEDLQKSIQYFFGALVFYCFSEILRPIENQIILSSKMNANCFALGRPRKESKRQKQERLRKESIWKRREERRTQTKVFLKKQPLWRLLPTHACAGFAFWMDTLHGTTFFEKKHSLLQQIIKLSEPVDCPFKFPSSDCNFQLDFLEKTKEVESLLYKNQELRWRFKIFLNKIRIQKMKKANEDDPFTLECCKQPIQVVSYTTKVIYTFEAESFMKHVTKRLLNNDGHIAQPLFPQNPLTNETFTLAQIIGLLRQLRVYGHTSWPMESFSSCGYNLERFISIHTKPLRLHALHATMKKYDDWEQIDTLLDFIKSQHRTHERVCEQVVYRWAILHLSEHDIIQAWRKLCIKWYEVDILLDDESVRDREYTKLEALTLALCNSPSDLIKRRKTYFLEKSRENGSRSP